MNSKTKRPVRIGVVDYGMGNLHSVAKALSSQGGRVTVSDDRSRLKSSDLLVLPGVGSFGAAMRNLSRKGLDDFIHAWIEDKKSYLGICLGLQLLFERSEEDPGVPGLGVLKGRVFKFRSADFKKGGYCVPHMGWNTVVGSKKRNGIFKGIAATDSFYFVHTFYPAPKEEKVVCTKTVYGKPFCSSVQTERLFASQFHPEKSGNVGLTLLSNIIRELASES